ncbi:MAG: LysE family transporter [Flavobacteriales bacterium]|nr:LysE family transporter [Flavobacteriales bacterium]MBP6697428.1 LysE family transporter [Flavobacteriales bacterium]
MTVLLVFLVASVASFIGSLQAGLVNTAVLAASLSKGEYAGRMTAWGGALPELLYAGLAVLLVERSMDKVPWLTTHAPFIAGILLVGLGAYFLIWPPFSISTPEPAASSASFGRGVMWGLMNPQLLLFWLGIAASLRAYMPEAVGPGAMVAFALGAFAGALVLLLLLVRFARTLQHRLDAVRLRRLFRLIGLALLIAGLWTAMKAVPPIAAGI